MEIGISDCERAAKKFNTSKLKSREQYQPSPLHKTPHQKR